MFHHGKKRMSIKPLEFFYRRVQTKPFVFTAGEIKATGGIRVSPTDGMLEASNAFTSVWIS